MDPLTAKLRFRFRTFNNWIIIIGIFSFVAVFDNWVADILTIAILFYLYFFILDKRPIRLRCPKCDRTILSSTPWVCKACGSKNMDGDNHPFVFKCRNCGVEPKAYRCHHKGCGEMIFLTEDQDETNYASGLNSPAEIPQPDKRTVKAAIHQEVREDKEHDIAIAKSDVMLAELDAHLKEVKRKAEPIKIKSPVQQKEEGLKNFLAGVMGARELAAKQKAENTITYKDSPDDLKDANKAVDDWLIRNI